MGKSVFVTGITSNKGSAIAYVMHGLGFKVFGMGIEPGEDSLFKKLNIEQLSDSYIVDIRQPLQCSIPFLVMSECDIVIHALENDCMEDDFDIIKSINVNGIWTLIVLENFIINKKYNTFINTISPCLNKETALCEKNNLTKQFSKKITSVYAKEYKGKNIGNIQDCQLKYSEELKLIDMLQDELEYSMFYNTINSILSYLNY